MCISQQIQWLPALPTRDEGIALFPTVIEQGGSHNLGMCESVQFDGWAAENLVVVNCFRSVSLQ